MNKMLCIQKGAEVGFGLTAITVLVIASLGGCGGGGGGGGTVVAGVPTVSLSGVVADGYIKGAKVCLDLNGDGMCTAGEPSGTSAASGVYSIPGITPGDEKKFSVVAEVQSNSIDEDFPASTVGTAYTLTAPVGASFVSPVTTLMQANMATGATSAAAEASVLAILGIGSASGVSALDNYVVKKGAATPNNQDTNLYARVHEAAKVVAAVFKQAKASLGSTATSSLAEQAVLSSQAQIVLSSQAASNVAATATMFSPLVVSASSVAPASTLQAAVAAKKVPAANAATQAVTINFDVINGATPVGTTGCSTPLTLGNAGTIGTLSALKFYASNISLIDSKGGYSPLRLTENANQGRNVALLNFENGTGTCAALAVSPAYTAVTGTVAPAPAGTTYVGVAFTVGVPQYSNLDTSYTPALISLNHSDAAATTTPLPLQDIGMAWNWQSGRKFSRIEFKTSAVAPVLTMVHLGSTGCTANPLIAGTVVTTCAGPNNVPVTFTSGFAPGVNKITLDLGSLFGGLNLTTSQTWMSGRVAGMMTANPAYYYDKYQLDLTTGLPINGGISATTLNPLFVIK